MKEQLIFWLMIVVGIIVLLSIAVFGKAVTAIITKGEAEAKDAENKGSDTAKKVLGVLLMLGASQQLSAQGPDDLIINIQSTDLWFMVAINVTLVAVLWHFKGIFSNIFDSKFPNRVVPKKPAKPARSLQDILVDSVKIEDEKDILMDHEYDGIRELDNNLPPWWKWGFYLTIVIGVLYLGNYHVLKLGLLQAEEYEESVAKGEAEVEAYLARQQMNVDESSVEVLTGASEIKEGRAIFMKNCKSCHGDQGQGGVGPNLTDNHWLHGGDIKSVFSTIKYGAPNGMQSWKDELNGLQMQKVASFIASIKGTNPPNAKAPEGNLEE